LTELRHGASVGAVGCSVSSEAAVNVWLAVHEVSSGGLEGALRSMIGCAACRPVASGVVSGVGVGPAGCWQTMGGWTGDSRFGFGEFVPCW
jgi:hypothetical protein